MARQKKKTVTEWTPDAIESYLQTQVNAQAAGKGFLVSSDGAAADIGIRLPHFCLRYLYHRTTIPFERTTILYGPTGSSKSSYLFWLYWLFRTGGGQWSTPHGKYYHLGVEDKDSPLLRLSLTDYDDQAGYVRECASLNEFQIQIVEFLDWFKSRMGTAGGPGKRIPLIIGIDSLVAKMTAEAAKTVDTAHGETKRRFADEARALSDWFKYIPSKLREWPIHMVGVNHDKPKPGENGRPEEHRTPGGSAPNYYATYKILLKRVKTLDETATGWNGNRIRFKMEKNSLGSDNHAIEANIIWRTIQRPNAAGDLVPAQQTMWDWHRATTEILYQIARVTHDRQPAKARAVREVLGINRIAGGRYVAPEIGITDDNPLSAYDFGVYLEKQTDVLQVLENRLGVSVCREHRPGEDLGEAQLAARETINALLPTTKAAYVDWNGEVDTASDASAASVAAEPKDEDVEYVEGDDEDE